MRRAIIILIPALLAGCSDGVEDSWDHSAKFITTNKPNPMDIAGVYLLTEQTITTNGLADFKGYPCRLDLQTNGFFAVTNYPCFTNDTLSAFITTTGRWDCATTCVVRDKDGWGIRFADSDRRMVNDSLSLTGKCAPYGLLMTYGDPDENTVLIFSKKP